MRDFEHGSIKRSVGGLTRRVPIVLALTVDCRDGWVVRDLLRDVLELVGHVLVRLPQDWVERLSRDSFDRSLRCAAVDRYQAQPHY